MFCGVYAAIEWLGVMSRHLQGIAALSHAESLDAIISNQKNCHIKKNNVDPKWASYKWG